LGLGLGSVQRRVVEGGAALKVRARTRVGTRVRGRVGVRGRGRVIGAAPPTGCGRYAM